MEVLREMGPVRQILGEPRRRWFASERCDLIVWLDANGDPEAFQFCYDKDEVEHAATWRPSLGFSHMRVDCGPGFSFGSGTGTPFLVPDGTYDASRMLALFEREAALVPAPIVELVTRRLRELGGRVVEAASQ